MLAQKYRSKKVGTAFSHGYVSSYKKKISKSRHRHFHTDMLAQKYRSKKSRHRVFHTDARARTRKKSQKGRHRRFNKGARALWVCALHERGLAIHIRGLFNMLGFCIYILNCSPPWLFVHVRKTGVLTDVSSSSCLRPAAEFKLSLKASFQELCVFPSII